MKNFKEFLFLLFLIGIIINCSLVMCIMNKDQNITMKYNSSLDSMLSNCSIAIINPIQPPAYNGWPYALLCERLVYDNYVNDDYMDNEEGLYQCLIWSSRENLLFNHTDVAYKIFDSQDIFYDIPEVQYNQRKFFLYVKNLNTGKCFYSQIQLKIEEHLPKSCEEYQASQLKGFFRTKVNQSRSFECQFKTYLNYGLNASSLSFHWLHGCNELTTKSKQFEIAKMQPSDSGIYTCYVSYNGMVRYVWTKQICVNYEVDHNTKPVVKCQTNMEKKLLSETAIFQCYATYGNGNPTKDDFTFSWKRMNESDSEARFCKNTHSSDDDETSSCFCFVHFDNSCFQTKEKNAVPFQFIIRNITETDYGSFVIKVATPTKYPPIFITLTLQKNKVPFCKNFIFIVGISIAVLLTFVFLSMIAFYNSIYIKVCMKRLFWKQESNKKKYDVLLAYHYSSSDDKFAKQQVKEAIPKIKTFLEEKGFTVCDENILFNAQGRAEFVQSLLAESHRILIFLSSGFIKDDWSLFSLQKGFNEMVNNGTRIIFLILPGVKKHLKQKSTNERTYEVIERALKTNYVIRYPESAEFFPTKFLYQLEYALPKLKRKKTKRNLIGIVSDRVDK